MKIKLYILISCILLPFSLFGQNNIIPDAQNCGATRPPFSFDVSKRWESSGVDVSQFCTPLAADLDGDGKVEVIVTRATDPYGIVLFDGATGAKIGEITTLKTGFPAYFNANATNPYVICDVEGDGKAEIFVASAYENKVMLFTVTSAPGVRPITFSKRWELAAPNLNWDGASWGCIPFVADLDGDGLPEFIAGHYIIESNGTKSSSTLPYNGTVAAAGSVSVSFAVDLDADGIPEVVAGTDVFKYNGSTLTLWKRCPAYGGLGREGTNTAADINLDGKVDLVYFDNSSNSPSNLTIWTPSTGTNAYDAMIIATISDPVGGFRSYPVAGDIDGVVAPNGKKYPEVCFNSPNFLYAYSFNPVTSTFSQKWKLPTTDGSGMTTFTFFDFNLDGAVELVYRDEQNLRVYDCTGSFPVEKFRMPVSSGTLLETPIVADITTDGSANIAVTGNGKLYVFESLSSKWASCPGIWNQQMYSPLLINRNLTVTRSVQSPAWVQTDSKGNEVRYYNGGPMQVPFVSGSSFDPIDLTPDIYVVSGKITIVNATTVTIEVIFGNQGIQTAKAATPIRFYQNAISPTNVLASANTTLGSDLPVGQTLTITKTFTGLSPMPTKFYVRVMDDGVNFPASGVYSDCNLTNNTKSFGTLELTKTVNSLSACINGTSIFTVKVINRTNETGTPTTYSNIAIADSLDATWQFISATPVNGSAGTFNPTTRKFTWNIPTIAPGDTAKLIATAKATAAGVIHNNAWIASVNGTAVGREAMEAYVIVANQQSPTPPIITPTEASVCPPAANTTLTGITPGAVSYQWYRNGNAIPGATSGTYSATQAGSYMVTYTNGTCISQISAAATVTFYPAMTAGVISTAQSVCYNTAPSLLTGTMPTGGDGTYTYQWQSSTDLTNWTNISGATLQNYAPGALITNTYYRRLATGTCGTLISNVILITVYGQLNPGTINNGGQTIICYNAVPSAFNGTVSSGGSGFTYQWQTSPDNIAWTNISGATGQNYTPGAYTTSAYIRRQTIDPLCGTVSSNVIFLTVRSPLVPGTISSSQNICFNTAPAQLTGTLPTGGAGVYTYQWQSSDGASVVWSNIPGATAQNYAPGMLTASTAYRRVVIGLCATAITNEVMINVFPSVTAANITSTTGATICSGTTATISATTNAASVEWYSNAALTIRVGTNLSYTTPVLNTTTTYYVVAKHASGCVAPAAEATPVTVTVEALPTAANILTTTSPIICAGEVATLSVTTDLASVEWYSDAALITRVGTDLSYTTPPLTNNTYYYVVAKGASGCIAKPAAAKILMVVVNFRPPKAQINSTTAPSSVCYGKPATISATLVSGTLAWYSDPGLTNFLSNQTSYTTPPLTATTTFYAAPINIQGCLSVPANATAVTVNVAPLPTVANITSTIPATICSGGTATISATTDASGVKWYSDAALTNQVGSNLSYTTPVLNATTTYYVVASNANGCPGAPDAAVPVTVTVNPRPTSGNITGTTDASICTGTVATISATTDAASIEWYSDALLTTRIATGLTYTTPVLSSTTTYYVVAKNASGCIGLSADAKPVTVTVNARPTATNITGTTPATICAGTAATISATTDVAGVEWYSDAALTNRVETDLSYTTPVLSSTTTYYVVAKNASGCIGLSADAKPVTVTVNARPTAANITGTTPATICSGTTATINATTNSAGVEWYSDAALTTRVGTALSYTTPVLSSTTTYYVVAKNALGCIGIPAAAKPVTVTVNALPMPYDITGTTSQNICSGTTTTISATTDAASVEWYSDAALTNRVGTALSYTTPVISSTTTYYVVAVNAEGCRGAVSAAYPVIVAVNPLPVPVISGPNSVCENTQITYSTQTGSITNYQWVVTGGTIVADGGVNDRFVTVKWSTVATGSVSVNYTNASGCTANAPAILPITINDRPEQSFIEGNGSVCLNAIQTYTTAAGMNSYTWKPIINGSVIAGGGSSDNFVTIQWPATPGSGSLSVDYVNSAGCQPNSFTTFPVIINDILVPTISGPETICEGVTETYSTETGMTNYVWGVTGGTITAGGTSADNTVTVLWDNTRTGSISVNYQGDGLCTPAEGSMVTITINARPNAGNITGTTEAAICLGETATVSATTSAAGVEWYSDAALNDLVSEDLTYTIPGLTATTTYYVVAKNANGCIAEVSEAKAVTVTVNNRPTAADITGNTPASICTGQQGTISATTNAASVEWYSDAALTNRVGTALSYTTPALSATTTYYVVAKNAAGCIATPANATSVTVTVVPLPTPGSITSTTPATICSGETTVISATTNASGIAWYTEAALTNKVGSGLSYTTPVLSATTTYYAVATNSMDCSGLPGAAVPVTVTVNPLPTIDDIIGTEGDIICAGQAATIYSFSSTRSVEWYTDAALTNRVGTDADYTTPVLTATTTYYVVAKSSAGCIGLPADARAVTVTVNPRPTVANITGTTPATICNGQKATISATTNAASVEWFTDAALTNRVGTNLSYTTPPLSAGTSYYVVAKNASGCIATASEAVQVTVTVNSRPTAANITNASGDIICEGEMATISAVTSASSVEWYSDASLLNRVGTDLSYTTPPLSTTTNYYVVAKNATGCIAVLGQAVQVVVSVNNRPAAANILTWTDAEICSGTTAVISVTTNAAGVEWYSDAALGNKIGSDLSYTTPVLNTTTTYYVVARNANGCTAVASEAVPVTVTVNRRPTAADIISTTGATICSGQTATIISVSNVESVEWYTDAALTNKVGEDMIYTTPVLTATTTYYVVAETAAGCISVVSDAKPVTVTVNDLPTAANITSISPASVCSGQTATISAVTNAVSVEWYIDAGLMERVGTDLSYTTPVLNASTTYYVIAKNTAGCIALPDEAVAVTVTVNEHPTMGDITGTTPATICSGTTATISATTSAASVEWFSDAALINRIGQGLSYTTPVLTANTTYYVAAKSTSGCVALPDEAVPVTVVVNDLPARADITSTIPATICSGETAVISATAETSGVEWYSDAALLNKVGTDLTYTTPVLTASTTYYVVAVSAEGCIGLPGDAIAVTVTVNSLPAAADITSTTPATICSDDIATISATTNAASVEWYTDAILSNRVGTSLSFTTPSLSATTTYYVVAKNASGCIGLPADAKTVTVTVNPRPTAANITGTTPATICSESAAIISVTTNAASVTWYTDAELHNEVGTELSYTTPALSSTTTYYVAGVSASGCISLSADAVPVTVTVNPRPTAADITSTTPATICRGTTATISATTDAASVEWYKDAALTIRVGTDLSYTTLGLSATTTYYVVAVSNEGCRGLVSAAVPVTVTVNPLPVVTINGPGEVCTGDRTIYGAPASMAHFQWEVFSDATIDGSDNETTAIIVWGETASPPTHHVKVTITDSNGCINSTTLPVNVTHRTETGPIYRIPNED